MDQKEERNIPKRETHDCPFVFFSCMLYANQFRPLYIAVEEFFYLLMQMQQCDPRSFRKTCLSLLFFNF